MYILIGSVCKLGWHIFGQCCAGVFKLTSKSFRFKLKTKPDVEAVSPKPRLRTYGREEERVAEVRLALTAFCNWRPGCPSYATGAEVDNMDADAVLILMELFVFGDGGFCRCPVFLHDQWRVGLARRRRKSYGVVLSRAP